MMMEMLELKGDIHGSLYFAKQTQEPHHFPRVSRAWLISSPTPANGTEYGDHLAGN